MKRMMIAALAALLSGAASAEDYEEMRPKDSKLRLGVLGEEAEGSWFLEEKKSFGTFRCDYGYWGFDDDQRSRVKAQYCWSDNVSSWDDSGGYTGEEADTDEFLEWNDETRLADSRDNAEEGPTIETVVGDVVVHAFDVEKDTSWKTYRECMGFHMVWGKGYGVSRKLYAKSLTFYACDNATSTMSEAKLLRILSSFSIEGEFDALVEN